MVLLLYSDWLLFFKEKEWNSSTGKTYVTETGQKIAFGFLSGGSTVTNYGYYNASNMNFNNIANIRVDKDAIYIFDWSNGALKKFDLFGNFIWLYGDKRNETGYLNLDSSSKMDIDANYVYLPELYTNSIHIIRKDNGTLYNKVLRGSGYIHPGGTVVRSNGNFIVSKHGVINTHKSMYDVGSISTLKYDIGPINETYMSLYTQTVSNAGQNFIHKVNDMLIVSSESTNPYIFIYNMTNTPIGSNQGRKTINNLPSMYSYAGFNPYLNEVWIISDNRIYAYDYSHFKSSSTPSVKRIIETPYPVHRFDCMDM